jgi:hypothetical protein
MLQYTLITIWDGGKVKGGRQKAEGGRLKAEGGRFNKK